MIDGTQSVVDRMNMVLSVYENNKQHLFTAEETAIRDESDFFNKIALGCGAVISVVFSVMAGKALHLHPHWLLKTAMISLFLTLGSAVIRNRFALPWNAIRLQLSTHQNSRLPLEHLQQYAAAIPGAELFPSFQKIEDALKSPESGIERIKTLQAEAADWSHRVLRWGNICLAFLMLSGIQLIALLWINV